MLYFFVLVSLPILTLGILGPLLYARSIERETTDHTARMIGQVTLNMESRVNEMERLIDLIAAAKAVTPFFDLGEAGGAVEDDILRVLSAVSGTHEEIAGILIVSRDDRWVSGDYSRVTRDPLVEESWYREAADKPGRVRLLARPFGRNIRSRLGYGADEVVSVVKSIVDPADGSVRGVVLIDMKLLTMERIFRDTSLGKDGFLFIADAMGELVYAPRNKVVYRVPPAALGAGPAPVFFRHGGVDYQVLSESSAYTGWRTLGVFSVDEALREVILVRLSALVIGGVTVVLAVVAALFFTASVSRPVLALRSLMKRAEEGELSVRYTGGVGDEIGELGHGLNQLLGRIEGLIGQVYSEQKAKREAELGILQEQIKPHFLYNTLDTIQWLAQEGRADDVVSTVGALSSLFRIGLSKGRELIDLTEELRHVESYLYIQKMRYEDKFDYGLEVGEGLGGLKVLRLILQPLVENALYHGIKESRGNGRLVVTASRRGGELALAVRDDGVGLEPPRLAALNAALAADDFRDGAAGVGYGIRNVHERLALSFGPPFGLVYSSPPGGGLEALVRHPILLAEDE